MNGCGGGKTIVGMKLDRRMVITREQREEITRRVLAGEKAVALGEEFGVTRAYVSLLKAQALDPERFEKKRLDKALKLTPAQAEEFRLAILKSDPSELGLDPPTRAWCMDHGYQLAQRMFGKRPGVRMMKECMEPVLRSKRRFFKRPQAPEPHHISQLDPELARDPDFVKYYLSPVCERIARREYEIALEDWVARYGDAEEISADGEPVGGTEDFPAPLAGPALAPGRRTGKHAGSKGLAFTPSKKKRRKKGRK